MQELARKAAPLVQETDLFCCRAVPAYLCWEKRGQFESDSIEAWFEVCIKPTLLTTSIDPLDGQMHLHEELSSGAAVLFFLLSVLLTKGVAKPWDASVVYQNQILRGILSLREVCPINRSIPCVLTKALLLLAVLSAEINFRSPRSTLRVLRALILGHQGKLWSPRNTLWVFRALTLRAIS